MSSVFEGVLYQATGMRRYLALCACSVQSLRWAGWQAPVRVLVDNRDFDESLFAGLDVEFHTVQVPSEGKMNSRWIKTRLPDYSPFERTLFLDCDIIVLQHPHRLWEEMGKADFALAPCYFDVEQTVHASPEELKYTLDQGIRGTQYNGGVKAWHDGEKSRAFFEAWHQEWQRFGHIDQLALLRALKRSPMNLHELPKRFNYLQQGSLLQLQHEGVVFWHPVGGYDVSTFRTVFGEGFENRWRALGLSKHDVSAPHHIMLRRKFKKMASVELVKRKLRRLKKLL